MIVWELRDSSLFHILLIMIVICQSVHGDVKVTVTRHYKGDIYSIEDDSASSGAGNCVCGEGSDIMTRPTRNTCQCQCSDQSPAFRDDVISCINHLSECVLADFVSSSNGDSEKIPYVYIPLKGQLVNPTAEVALLGVDEGGPSVVSPVCVVTRARVLTAKGWQHLANTSTYEPPFRLYRDSGRTYVQWVGEEGDRTVAEGRIVLVSLLCRDAAVEDAPLFNPCLAFRVAGTRGGDETTASLVISGDSEGTGLTSGESLIIGIVVSCLVLVYVVAMTVYLKLRSKRDNKRHHLHIDRMVEEGEPSCAQGRHTGASGKSRKSRNSSKITGGRAHKHIHPERPPPKPSLVSSEDDTEHEDLEDLSQASRQYKSYIRGIGNHTRVEVHKYGRRTSLDNGGSMRALQHDSADGIERAPHPAVAVVETHGMGLGHPRVPVESSESEETSQNLPGGHTKKKLYFNPAYFEPELLQTPPPAALEFLSKIREMISVAKNKMKSKTYHPSLIDIPEDDYYIEHSSRPTSSRTIRSSSRLNTYIEQDGVINNTFIMDEGKTIRMLDNTYIDANIIGNSMFYNSDSLERPHESDSRSSTLKRLAKRVNSHGQSIVSEIIRTLDLKPRLPEGIYGMKPKKNPAPKPPVPPPRPVNAREAVQVVENDYPELIKPSMIRNVLKDGKKLTDLNNTFESFRHEMMATFHKMRKVGETISPKSTLTRNKNKDQLMPNTNESDIKLQPALSEKKVHRWLQTLDTNNPYSRISETSNIIFETKTKNVYVDFPPPLPARMTKPPTPPRKGQSTIRSVSFSELREPTSLLSAAESLGHDEKSRSPEKSSHINNLHGKTGALVARSLSWQSEHRHYDSAPRRPKLPTPVLSEDNLNTSFGSEDDSVSDLLSEAESKMPKVIPSDSESVYSDTKSGYQNSLEYSNGNSEMNNTYQNTNYIQSDEHAYEEITFGKQTFSQNSSKNNKKRHALSNRLSNGRKYDAEEIYSIYSNPDSLVSEIHVPGEKINSSAIYSGSKISIPLLDNVTGKEENTNFDQDTLERKQRKLERSNSIHQDSLERPKVIEINENISVQNYGHRNIFRNKSMPSQSISKKDHTLIGIYESRNSINGLKHSNNESNGDMPTSPIRKQSFFSSNDEVPGKKLKTFKDYQLVKFNRDNDNRINCMNGSENSFQLHKSAETRPPLPLKQTQSIDISSPSPNLPPKRVPFRPPLPEKQQRKYNSTNYESDLPILPEKTCRKNSIESLSRPSSESSIPELTEEEARIILHGLLADSMINNSNRLSPLHEEDDDGHFLGLRNTVDDFTDSATDSVPQLDIELSSSTSLDSSASPEEINCEIRNVESKTLGKKLEHSLSNHLFSDSNYTSDVLKSPNNEEIVNGEFILSSNGRSPTMKRQSSLGRATTSNRVLAKIRDLTADLDDDTKSMGMEIALALKAKSLEKHLKEKSGADSIKRTWRKILEKVDDSKEDKDKISILELQKYIAEMGKKENETKNKQEDSGYQSSDSNDSMKGHQSKPQNDNQDKSSLDSPTECINKSNTTNAVTRAKDVNVNKAALVEIISSNHNNRAQDNTNLEKGHLNLPVRQGSYNTFPLSVYINDAFSIDGDDDTDSIADYIQL